MTTANANPATIITIGFRRALAVEAKTMNAILSVMSFTPLIVGAVFMTVHR